MGARGAITLRHLGAAGWEITAGERAILLDPYLSRLRITGQFGTYTTPSLPGDTRRIFGPDDDLVGDEAAVDAHITRADFILHSHSHFNHTIDMPYIARKTGATVIGTESTINLARAGGVPESQLLPVHGGEDWQFGDFSVQVIPSLHSALNGKHFFDSRVVPRDFQGSRVGTARRRGRHARVPPAPGRLRDPLVRLHELHRARGRRACAPTWP